jgi:hypothetical protein
MHVPSPRSAACRQKCAAAMPISYCGYSWFLMLPPNRAISLALSITSTAITGASRAKRLKEMNVVKGGLCNLFLLSAAHQQLTISRAASCMPKEPDALHLLSYQFFHPFHGFIQVPAYTLPLLYQCFKCHTLSKYFSKYLLHPRYFFQFNTEP